MGKMVGMSRNINLEQLNKVVECYKEYISEDDIKTALNDYLGFEIESPTNIRKTSEILMNIWVRNNEDMEAIRTIALNLAQSNNETKKIVAHWCMILNTYSIFSDIAGVIGKLEDKQLELTAALIKEKVMDVWGERQTLIHSIPKNIRTMKDMKVLEQIKAGRYRASKYEVKDPESAILIVATLIKLKEKLYLSVDEIMKDEVMFPFNYKVDIEALQQSELFSFDRFGGEMVVSLKE